MTMDYAAESKRLHEIWKGKIEVVPRVSVDNRDDLSVAYTPGVAEPCLEIQKDPGKSYDPAKAMILQDGGTCALS